MFVSRTAIAVVGSGSSSGPAVSDARELGRLIAENGWVLITGGRDAGVMRAANEGAKSAKQSLTIGILPDANTRVSPAVDVAIVTGAGEARNNIIVLSGDVIIACGVEDPGTTSEVALALKNIKPVIILGAGDAAREFFRNIAGDNIRFVETPQQAVQMARYLLGM